MELGKSLENSKWSLPNGDTSTNETLQSYKPEILTHLFMTHY